MSRVLGPVLFGLLVLLSGCSGEPAGDQVAQPAAEGEADSTPEDTGDDGAEECSDTSDAEFPDVVDATVERAGDGTYSVSATLCSAYDTPERYADAWRVKTPDGEVLGVRELLHDHASEQPFTRSLGEPIGVPDAVDMLVVEGRDLENGWGGATVVVDVPDAG